MPTAETIRDELNRALWGGHGTRCRCCEDFGPGGSPLEAGALTEARFLLGRYDVSDEIIARAVTAAVTAARDAIIAQAVTSMSQHEACGIRRHRGIRASGPSSSVRTAQ
ncbi:MAG TPA: hypothetical protein VGK16_02015 [Candidatus Limnocylindrales bacterium]|jgi:hypothetical protein